MYLLKYCSEKVQEEIKTELNATKEEIKIYVEGTKKEMKIGQQKLKSDLDLRLVRVWLNREW